MNCLFCKIINGDIPSEKVYENDKVYAFRDINPAAPVHILVVPKIHIANVNDTSKDNATVYSDLFLAIKKIANDEEIVETGYRTIINNGKAAGQEVFHLHIHILGGKESLGPMLT